MYNLIIALIILAVITFLVIDKSIKSSTKVVFLIAVFVFLNIGLSAQVEPSIWVKDNPIEIAHKDVKVADLYYHADTFESMLVTRTNEGKTNVYMLSAKDHKSLINDNRYLATLMPVKDKRYLLDSLNPTIK